MAGWTPARCATISQKRRLFWPFAQNAARRIGAARRVRGAYDTRCGCVRLARSAVARGARGAGRPVLVAACRCAARRAGQRGPRFIPCQRMPATRPPKFCPPATRATDLLAGVDLSRNTDEIASVFDVGRVAGHKAAQRGAGAGAGRRHWRGRFAATPPPGANRGRFRLLRAPDMPSALLELGFQCPARAIWPGCKTRNGVT